MTASSMIRSLGWSMQSVSRQDSQADIRSQDLALVKRTVDGDVDAYRELVERYQQRIHSVVLGIIGNFDDALDITQEAFIKAYNHLPSFRRHSGFYTWIYRIAYNLAIDEKRKRYRHVEQATGEVLELDRASHRNISAPGSMLSAGPEPDESVERAELRSDISAALDTLSDEHRAVIVLREIEGLSYSEISDVVGCSKGTVMSRLHHARKKMQDALRKSAASGQSVMMIEQNRRRGSSDQG